MVGAIMKPIKVAAKKVVEDIGDEPLSPLSQIFHKPDSNVYIVTIFGSKSLVDPESLKANLGQFVLSHPRLHSLQVLDEEKGGMKWVKTEVDLNKHVISPEIDLNAITSPDKFVEDYMHNLSKTRINMSKPLWDIHILNGLQTTSDTKAVAVLRMHHSIGDGMSLMSLLLTFAKRTSDNKPFLTAGVVADDGNKIPIVKMRKKGSVFMLLIQSIKYFWRLVWNTFVDILALLASAFLLKDSPNPLRPSYDVGYTPKRIAYRTVSLDDFKLITKATKTTVNDVVMGVTEAGLSRYLNRRYGEQNGQAQLMSCCLSDQAVNHLPRNMRLSAAVFFNIRVLAGFHAMEDMKEKGSQARWGNQIGYVVYPLNAVMRDNPLDYVRSAKATMDRKKASLESQFSYFLIKFMLRVFGVKVAKFPRSPSLYFSNMIGPREEIALFGYPITYVAATCYGVPSGLMMHVMSYMDKLTFAVAVDEGAVPDPHQLLDDLEESLNTIKQAVQGAEANSRGPAVNETT